MDMQPCSDWTLPLNIANTADNIYLIITWCKKVYPGQEEGLMGFFKEVSLLVVY